MFSLFPAAETTVNPVGREKRLCPLSSTPLSFFVILTAGYFILAQNSSLMVSPSILGKVEPSLLKRRSTLMRTSSKFINCAYCTASLTGALISRRLVCEGVSGKLVVACFLKKSSVFFFMNSIFPISPSLSTGRYCSSL